MTRIFKPDSGQDLKLQNNGGTGSVTITDTGDLTIDSPADIILDANGADVTLKDGGTTYGTLKQVSGDLVIQPASGEQIILNEDGGTAALTVDTSGDIAFSGTLNLADGVEASPATGDIWFADGQFHFASDWDLLTGVWATGGNLATARYYLAGAGTQSAGLCMGGTTGSYSVVTEEYNGTSWSSGGNLATARQGLAGAGTQSAGLCMGGYTGSNSAVTDE